MRERLLTPLTDLKRSAEEFPRFALRMVQALFPPPAVGLVAPEAVVEGSPRKLFWFSVYAGYYSTKAWWFSKTTNNHRASIYTVRSVLYKFIAL